MGHSRKWVPLHWGWKEREPVLAVPHLTGQTGGMRQAGTAPELVGAQKRGCKWVGDGTGVGRSWGHIQALAVLCPPPLRPWEGSDLPLPLYLPAMQVKGF